MQYNIRGTTMPTLELVLDPGERMFSQTHAFGWMSDPIKNDTKIATKPNQGLGSAIWGAIKRSVTGNSFWQNVFWAEGAQGYLAFNSKFPGHIVARKLGPNETIICRKETFLCAEASVTLDLYFRKQIGGGLFGGEGFLLQKVTGPGTVFLDYSGEMIEKTLRPGERLRVHVGHIGSQDEGVGFNVELVSGFKNFLFGGNGIFYAVLTGPGKVQLQSMPIAMLAEEIGRYIGKQAEQPQSGATVAADVTGSVLGGLLDGFNNS